MDENLLKEVLIEASNYDIYKKEKSSRFCVKCIIGLSLFATLCFTFLIIMYIINKPYVNESLQNIYDQQITSLMIISCVNNTLTFGIYFFLIYKN